MNAAELLLSRGMDETIALICGDSAMTYAQLRERVARVAGWLLAQGLRSGDRVIVIGADGNAWVIVWLATVWAGGVAVGLNPRLRSEEVGAVLNEVAPRLCFADSEAATCISSISLYTSVKLVALEGVDGLAAERVLPAACRAEDPAFWIYSSGTTGRPKAVVHAHRAVDACAAFAREVLAATAQDRFYATSRLFFAYALANSLFAALRLGATVILDPGWPTPEKSVDLLRRQRPTLLFSVPTFYHQLLACGAAASLGDTRVRGFVAAGESLPSQVAHDWQATLGRALISGYGMTETLAVVLYRDTARREASQLAPLAEMRSDGALAEAEAEVPVRLWFRHPSVALGYHRWPDLQQHNFRDGWCSTGDRFFSRSDARWEFAGREDDLVKVAGRWVSTLELQRELSNDLAADVRELAAIALAGGEGLTGLVLFAVARPSRENEARKLLQARLEQLPTHQRPRWCYWLNALPRNASGKLELARLKGIHAQAVESQG